MNRKSHIYIIKNSGEIILDYEQLLTMEQRLHFNSIEQCLSFCKFKGLEPTIEDTFVTNVLPRKNIIELPPFEE